MASYDYEKNKPDAKGAKELKDKDGKDIMVASSDMAPAPIDREKLARHDEQHHKDMALAASLQANWAMRVNAEHRIQ